MSAPFLRACRTRSRVPDDVDAVDRRPGAAGRWPRPRSRRASDATGVPRRRSARCAARVATFHVSRLRRGARPATRETSRAVAADPPGGRGAPVLPPGAGSRHRRSAAGARAPERSRRRAWPARRLRAGARRRAAIGPAAGIARARRMPRPPRCARSRPSERTRRPSPARRRGGSVERARGVASAGSISGAATVQMAGARAPSQRMATVPVGAAYLNAFGFMPSARPASRSATRSPPRWRRSRSAICSARRRPLAVVGEPPQREEREVALGDDVGLVPRPPELDERGMLPGRGLDLLDPRVQREERGSRHAVLQAGPRRPPQRLRAFGHSLVERDRPVVGTPGSAVV